MKISPRMQALLSECVLGLPVWDLCCDHGYLGIFAYHLKQFPKVGFVDQAPHSIELLKNNFEKYVREASVQTEVEFMIADAGQLTEALWGNIVIAGVGGKTVLRILTKLKASGLLKAQRLILLPHRSLELFDTQDLLGYTPLKRTQVLEKTQTRSIFVFEARDALR